MFRLVTGIRGPSGFGSSSTAEQVTRGIDASKLTAIITGGANGIGLETAKILALRNASVIIGARNMEAANKARDTIIQCNSNDNNRVYVLKLDLASLKSIKSFVDNFLSLNLPLNILINNAGIMCCPYQLSEDGLEMQFATNHLGHFYLTNLLLEKMKETSISSGIQGRIINLSSVAHIHSYKGGIVCEKINEKQRYNDKKAYGQSKLANILHAKELSCRLQAEGVNISVNAVHPGLILTNLFKHYAILMKFLKFFSPILWKNVSQGAATSCYVALHPDIKGVTGKYFSDCNESKPSKTARNEELRKKLWEFSCYLVKAFEKKF